MVYEEGGLATSRDLCGRDVKRMAYRTGLATFRIFWNLITISTGMIEIVFVSINATLLSHLVSVGFEIYIFLIALYQLTVSVHWSFLMFSGASNSFTWIYYLKLILFSNKQNVLFHVLSTSLLIPVNLLALLSIMSFLMPTDEPEKVNISVNILLSFTVFLTFVDNNVPRNSDNISLLGK